MDEDDEDEDMDDGGDDSFGEDDDMIGVSDVTNQLAAAGWQHGVKFCFVNTLLLLPTNQPTNLHVWLPANAFMLLPSNYYICHCILTAIHSQSLFKKLSDESYLQTKVVCFSLLANPF